MFLLQLLSLPILLIDLLMLQSQKLCQSLVASSTYDRWGEAKRSFSVDERQLGISLWWVRILFLIIGPLGHKFSLRSSRPMDLWHLLSLQVQYLENIGILSSIKTVPKTRYRWLRQTLKFLRDQSARMEPHVLVWSLSWLAFPILFPLIGLFWKLCAIDQAYAQTFFLVFFIIVFFFILIFCKWS